MSKLGKILSADSCGKCRVCCGFTRDDIWEIPLIYTENRTAVEERLGVKLIPRGEEFVFDMEFGGEISFCPALSENGCALGELKPFDCAVWPFRVNALRGDLRVITVSPVCETVYSLPLKTLSEFVQGDGFAEMLFAEAKKHPEIVKPYIDGYPILAVEKNK